MPIFRLFRPLVLCVLLLVSLERPLAAQLLPDEESARFMARIQASVTGKDVEGMLKEVWWTGADAQSRSSLKEAFSQIVQLKIASMKFREPGAEDDILNHKDSDLVTTLPVRSILSLELSPEANPSPDSTFLFEYPVGVSEGKVWILPILDRGKK